MREHGSSYRLFDIPCVFYKQRDVNGGISAEFPHDYDYQMMIDNAQTGGYRDQHQDNCKVNLIVSI